MVLRESHTAVATVIEPDERVRFDAAVGRRCRAIHAASLTEVIRAVRERPVRAVLVSPRCVGREHLPTLATLIHRFPGVPLYAVVARHDAVASERLLELGACGVRAVVDLTGRAGWRRIRDLLAEPLTPPASRILSALVPALGEPTPSCRHFFEVLVRVAPATTTVRRLARRLSVGPSTFMSRFLRAAVPSPKRYLAAVRLVHAAYLLEAPGLSVADVAYRLEYSSPQSFGRHVRAALGMTAAEFRTRCPFAVALHDFLRRLIVPFRPRFRTFHPLDHGVADHGHLG